MKKDREKCVLCDSKNLKQIFTFGMPIYMGVLETKHTSELFCHMTFLKCQDCHEVQIKELIDLDILYQSNHNIGVIGPTWTKHYSEFANFIQEDIIGKNVLEISDPSAKIAKLSKDFNEWLIIEPNPEKFEIKNVKVEKAFFDSDFKLNKKYDVIIHSHLLEHIHDPNSFFKLCYDSLTDDGMMLLSIPDMYSIAKNNNSPNNILHFEHTYYLDSHVLNYLAGKNGFRIIAQKPFNGHSLFYKLEKSKIITKTSPELIDFKGLFNFHKKYVADIKKLLHTSDLKVYLFGAHVSSQFYLSNGLTENYLTGILDNSVEKQGHTLYGFNLNVSSPHIIEKHERCIVICSHTGIYKDEIEKQLKKINKNVIIL